MSCLLYSSAAGDHAEPRLERWPCCVRCHLGCAHNIEESQITAPEGDGGLCVVERAGVCNSMCVCVCVTARNWLFYSRTSWLPPSRLLSTASAGAVTGATLDNRNDANALRGSGDATVITWNGEEMGKNTEVAPSPSSASRGAGGPH